MSDSDNNTVHRVHVSLDSRSYEIIVGHGVLANAAKHIVPKLKAPKAIIIADEAVWQHYGVMLEACLKAGNVSVNHLLVAGGEASKSFACLQHVLDQLLTMRIHRTTTIIALGGGVIGDLAGFAASIVLRGVPFIQIPTTLLAQVDSSVGGKTGINTPQGKNLVGAFYQPELVLIDAKTLQTLPVRHMRAGYAEIIKYGLIGDANFYDWCIKHGADIIAGKKEHLLHAITTSCQMKAHIVAADERESGIRAHLNFGHTFGHALEAELGYGDDLYHGEAVALGMVMACDLSSRLGYIDDDVKKDLLDHFRGLGLYASLYDTKMNWSANSLIHHMRGDKKAQEASLNFIVLKKLGCAVVEKRVNESMVREIIDRSKIQN